MQIGLSLTHARTIPSAPQERARLRYVQQVTIVSYKYSQHSNDRTTELPEIIIFILGRDTPKRVELSP